MERTSVIEQWFKGEDTARILEDTARILYEYGCFATYEDARKCTKLTENPACFPIALPVPQRS
jgi:hypothetical protein